MCGKWRHWWYLVIINSDCSMTVGQHDVNIFQKSLILERANPVSSVLSQPIIALASCLVQDDHFWNASHFSI